MERGGRGSQRLMCALTSSYREPPSLTFAYFFIRTYLLRDPLLFSLSPSLFCVYPQYKQVLQESGEDNETGTGIPETMEELLSSAGLEECIPMLQREKVCLCG